MLSKIKDFLNEEITKVNLKDIITVIIIMIIYSIISFYRLGDRIGINTYEEGYSGNKINIKLDREKYIDKIVYYTGHNDASFSVYIKEENELIYYINNTSKGVFSWNEINISNETDEIEIKFDKTSSIGELALYDVDGNIIDYKTSNKNLYDEKNKIPTSFSYMNTTYFDEVYFASAAYEYVYNLKIGEWTHPPLGKIIQAIPIYITQNLSPFNYRLMSNIAGILIIGAMYLMGAAYFKKRKYACLSSIIMSLDTFHMAHTRMGTVDPHLVLFIILASFFMITYVNSDKVRYLVLSGIFFALSVCIKWTGLYGGIGLAIIYFTYMIKNKKFNIKHIIYGFSFFVVIPIIIYTSTFLIFSNNLYKTNTIKNTILQNKTMYEYHSKLTAEHFFSSKWYTWPVDYKPVWFYVQEKSETTKETISNVGNIILWIGGLIGIIYTLVIGIYKKDKMNIFLVITVLGLWLPYAFIPRVMFMYHYYPALPFVFLGLVNILKDLNEKYKLKYLIPIVLVCSLLFFVIYFPISSGQDITNDYAERLKLFENWYF